MEFTKLSREEILDLAKPTKEYAEMLHKWPSAKIDWDNQAKAVKTLRDFNAMVDEFDESDPAVHEESIEVPAADGHRLPGIVFRSKQRPARTSPPLVVLYHGGGYVFGTPRQMAGTARSIVKRCGAVVVSQSYRRSPEHPSPTPIEDIRDTFYWIARHATTVLRSDPSKGLVIGGVSAGATASIVVSHLARDEHFQPPITGLWASAASAKIPLGEEGKLNPIYRDRLLSRTQPECLDEPLLSAALSKFINQCVRHDWSSKLCAPLLWPGGHKALPKTYFQVCGRDPARDEALILEDILKSGGTETKLDVYAGLPHCFWMSLSGLPETKKWESDTVDGVVWLLSDTKR